MRLLLDTCTFPWIVGGSSRLSAAAREAHRDPSNAVLLSAVSSWEIAVEHAMGRLRLPDVPARFVPMQRAAHSVAELPLTEGAALRVALLPALHRDPFDRMLVAQALEESLTIVTPDPAIHEHPVRTLW